MLLLLQFVQPVHFIKLQVHRKLEEDDRWTEQEIYNRYNRWTEQDDRWIET
ncbi:hypothetical protein ES332_A12G041500v1 [Gossypium tomentosum]|uniref:Uncharacterized protein n=1 Tax=Gossypium tomentosum TaxID=34277 RepID=A0A5D2MS42_GOSTO|nr:hypothetical protein ES332_A12G041500v1 [Gossypium tomentosum]